MRLIEMLRYQRFSLIVSLPVNDPELAKAALEAGADALKVHIHVTHRASGTRFGSLAEERKAIERICALSDRPVGLVPGEVPFASPEELAQAVEIGIGFVDAYVNYLPAYALTMGLTVMAALGHGFGPMDASALHGLPFVHCIEASIVHPSEYGTPLRLIDLVHYRQIVMGGDKPVVVPSQRALKPHEVPLLAATGVRAVVLGAIVTGTTPATLFEAVSAFRAAVDAQRW